MKQQNPFTVRVSVIGAGLMGHGIAQVFMVAGYDVSLWDPVREARESAVARIAGHLALLGDDHAVTVRICDTLADCVTGSDLVIEAAPEKLDIKRALIEQIEGHNDRCIIATNTSVLRITEIASAATRPECVIGTHWWNPPYLIPVVEVVRGERTSAVTAAQVTAWLEQANKVPVDVYRDVPGFVGNRMQFALLREAAHIVEQGICSAETVDLVARLTFGRRLPVIGPLRNADFIGLDLTSDIMHYLAPSLSVSSEAPRLFQDKVAEGKVGAKSGGGVFAWDGGDRADVEHQLLKHLTQMDALENKTRD